MHFISFKDGGHLAYIETIEEWNNLGFVITQGAWNWITASFQGIWTGAHRFEDNDFYWGSNNSTPVSDWLWAPDRPKDNNTLLTCVV